MASKRDRLTLSEQDDILVLDFGEMQIWDGADLSLLRETLARVIEVEKRPRVGIRMAHVQYVPSGFFGMLYDWHEREGTTITLHETQGNVLNMLWYQQFFDNVGDGLDVLRTEPKSIPAPPQPIRQPAPWNETPRELPMPMPQAAAVRR